VSGAPFVARVARGKLLLLFLLGVSMAAVALFVAVLPDLDAIERGFGWLGVVFFAFCLLAIARQFFRAGVVLEIGPEGVLWRRWSAERVPWDAFACAEDMAMRRLHFVSLWLRDPESYRSNTVLGRLAGANKALGFGDINLSAQGLSCSHAELLAAVRGNAPHLFA
jgi:hypothetical protein